VKTEPDIAGMAALSICESLLLSLTERQVIGREEALAVLDDAATAHRGATAEAKNPQAHRDAADLIERIIKGHNSVRHH